MKTTFIIALFSLIVMVKGAWWAAAVQPVILSLGAVLSAIDLDVLNIHLFSKEKELPDNEERTRATADDNNDWEQSFIHDKNPSLEEYETKNEEKSKATIYEPDWEEEEKLWR